MIKLSKTGEIYHCTIMYGVQSCISKLSGYLDIVLELDIENGLKDCNRSNRDVFRIW